MFTLDAILLVAIGFAIGVYMHHRMNKETPLTKTVYIPRKGLAFTKKAVKQVVSKRKTALTKKRKAIVRLYQWGVKVEETPSYTEIQRILYKDAESVLSHLNIVQSDDLFIFFSEGKPVYTVDMDTNHVVDVNALREASKKASTPKQTPVPTVPQEPDYPPYYPEEDYSYITQ